MTVQQWISLGLALYVFLGAVVGAMPARWRSTPYVGWLVRLLGLLAPLMHADLPGTLHLPLTSQVPALRDPDVPVRAASMALLVAGALLCGSVCHGCTSSGQLTTQAQSHIQLALLAVNSGSNALDTTVAAPIRAAVGGVQAGLAGQLATAICDGVTVLVDVVQARLPALDARAAQGGALGVMAGTAALMLREAHALPGLVPGCVAPTPAPAAAPPPTAVSGSGHVTVAGGAS